MNTKLSRTTQVVVVTYNPEIKLLGKNLHALGKQFDHIMVVDNNSKNIIEIELFIEMNNSKTKLHKLQDNMGIAYAQNIGLKEAINKKMDWLFTMDQDSVIPDNLTSEYQKVLDNYDKVGLIGWSQRKKGDQRDAVYEDWHIISSGCLMKVEALKKCDGFDEKLFIDHVDTDVNIKLKNLGYKILVTKNVKLTHELGTKSDKKTIHGNPYVTHSPVRIYYNVRNSVILFKRYFLSQPNWAIIAIKNCIKEGIYLLYYQDNKLKNFFLLLRAWFDGIFNRLGKFGD